ncbi:MAG: molybdopterin adenylyltransferase [Chloroflexi bacterium]|nr:molybdopterin adenylyltransferase [Chloroflexota bacterium]MBT7082445.1 molybdopterin adenylyltransferase [Chloroflexota bacterium]MBT7290028.1 molybdopterin adenylyltransferase [Chloroflexota bacterium]
MFSVGILTVSDKGSRGEREDLSSGAIKDSLAPLNLNIVRQDIVPDEKDRIAQRLTDWADSGEVDLIVTTGGTGLAPRDVTPDATLSIMDKEVPGFGEAIRAYGMTKVPTAILSRSLAAIRKRTLIINLPGSPKAVTEGLEAIIKALPHAIETLRGEVQNCAIEESQGI